MLSEKRLCTSYSRTSAIERGVDYTKYIVDKTFDHSQHFVKLIDDTVQLLEKIKTNNSLRRRFFWLSIITYWSNYICRFFIVLSVK